MNACLPDLCRGVLSRLAVLLVAVAVVGCSPDSGGQVIATGFCQPSGSRQVFTIATYNIHAGAGHDGKRDVGRIAAILKGVDVVALQEVDNNRIRSRFENQVKVISSRLEHRYWQHFPAEDYWPFGTYGTAASSALPVVESGMFDLPIVEGKALRRLAWVKFLVDCRPIHAFVIHATRIEGSNGNAQLAQIEAAWRVVSEKTEATGEPVILLGDFNADSGSQAIKWLRRRMVDVSQGGVPRLPPAVFLDYIFVNGDLEVVKVEVKDSGASDHQAIVATFRGSN